MYMPVKKFLFINVFSLILFYSPYNLNADETTESTEEPNIEEPKELDLGVFDQNYFNNLELWFENITSEYIARSLLSRFGKIALYIRLYRTWAFSPVTGHHGFNRYFPQPPIQFHPYIYGNCSHANFANCTAMIFYDIQQRAKFMFPLNEQKAEEFFQIDEQDFSRRVPNTKFSFDMSVSYLFCWLTKKQLSFLERLPFCSYGFEPHQNHEWPVNAFRQFSESPEIWSNDTNKSLEEFDPIDDIWKQNPFECADLSFCPDPCCGRNSTRFFNASNPPTNNSASGWCAHSACSMNNIRHLDGDVAKNFFRERKFQEDLLNKTKGNSNNGEENGETTNGTLTDDEGMHSAVNTHYCYLEESSNDDFISIMENRWNLSCACAFPDGKIDPYKIYRFDVKKCVDLDECIYAECPGDKRCINLSDGYTCQCPVGFRVDETNNSQCSQLELSFGQNSLLPTNLLDQE